MVALAWQYYTLLNCLWVSGVRSSPHWWHVKVLFGLFLLFVRTVFPVAFFFSTWRWYHCVDLGSFSSSWLSLSSVSGGGLGGSSRLAINGTSGNRSTVESGSAGVSDLEGLGSRRGCDFLLVPAVMVGSLNSCIWSGGVGATSLKDTCRTAGGSGSMAAMGGTGTRICCSRIWRSWS